MEVWVLFTLLAAVMQSIRTAAQKKLSTYLSPMATTLVRYMFGAPFAVGYLLLIASGDPVDLLAASIRNKEFFIYASLASVAQIVATACLVKTFSFRNFAVATLFSKTEAIQTAVLGVIFFGALLSWLGWLAVILGAVGIVIMSFPSEGRLPEARGVFYGVSSGLCFAFTALWLREASLSLHYGFVESAAVTLSYMVLLQTGICILFVWIKEKQQLALMWSNVPLAFFVGATSALGSVGWYTAMSYENAALVRSLGQIELIFALLISYLFFNEKISGKECLGMAFIACSILILLLFV